MPSQTFNSFYSSVYQHRKGSFHRLFAHKKSLFAFIFVIRVLYHMWESTMVINIIYYVVLEKFAGYFCSLEYHSKKKILFTGMPCQNWYTFFFFPSTLGWWWEYKATTKRPRDRSLAVPVNGRCWHHWTISVLATCAPYLQWPIQQVLQIYMSW